MALTYNEKLNDPRWDRRAGEAKTRDNYACRMCGSTTAKLDVHHRRYAGYNVDPWVAEVKDLLSLCRRCHNLERQNVELVRWNADWLEYQQFVNWMGLNRAVVQSNPTVLKMLRSLLFIAEGKDGAP